MDFNLITAKKNFNFFRNLNIDLEICKLHIQQDNSISHDNRWFQPIVRLKDGDSREGLIKPIQLTWGTLIDNNAYLDSLEMVLNNLKEYLIKLYGIDSFTKIFKEIFRLIKINILDAINANKVSNNYLNSKKSRKRKK